MTWRTLPSWRAAGRLEKGRPDVPRPPAKGNRGPCPGPRRPKRRARYPWHGSGVANVPRRTPPVCRRQCLVDDTSHRPWSGRRLGRKAMKHPHVDGIGWWHLALSVFAAGCASTPPPPGCRYFSRPRARPRAAPSITSTKRPMASRWVSPAFASASPGGPGPARHRDLPAADRDEILELRHRLSARDHVQPALDLSRQMIVYFSHVDRALGFSSVLAGASREARYFRSDRRGDRAPGGRPDVAGDRRHAGRLLDRELKP